MSRKYGEQHLTIRAHSDGVKTEVTDLTSQVIKMEKLLSVSRSR